MTNRTGKCFSAPSWLCPFSVTAVLIFGPRNIPFLQSHIFQQRCWGRGSTFDIKDSTQHDLIKSLVNHDSNNCTRPQSIVCLQ